MLRPRLTTAPTGKPKGQPGGGPGDLPGSKNATLIRVLSSIGLIPIALAVLYEGGWFFTGTVLVASLAMIVEWSQIIVHPGRPSAKGPEAEPGQGEGGSEIRYLKPVLVVLALAAVLALTAAGLAEYTFAMLIAISGGVLAIIVAPRRGSRPFWAGFGALYLIVPCVALIWLRQEPANGRVLTFMLFITVWMTDIAAFFIGRMMGGPKLNPVISPKKTWSGTVAGVVAGGTSFAVLGGFLLGGDTWIRFAVAGTGLAASSVIGDMVESAMKRGFGVKDSGSLIPGHGGVLDRLDGMIFATIALTLTLYIYRLFQSQAGIWVM